ncbi:Putative glycosyltransferase EpsF [Sporomusa ovata DSM 2662]|uniref:Capsular polysaccharide biosynthesis protein n=1 Tax=Sporomusa ovata TaxID=2378 RepID=A0A0U1KT17_9FIRM|nr:glycosyltransferase [Sporomusa ovata]EQB26453.1 putative glycosyltransferase EpsF [Sporomusa ovata DSM 2662]CQR70537.1 capsular polysaccharide biosynthesis protein [Sporomusa ovata]
MDYTRKSKLTERPIRVAVVMGKHVTGGTKSVIMNYYENINRNVIQFDFIVDSNSPLKDYSNIERLGGHVYEIPPVKHLWGHIFKCRKILKRENYLIVHGYVNTLNIFSMLAAKLAGVPVRIAENLSTAHAGEKKTIIKYILKPFAKWFPTHLAANSRYAAEWLYGKQALSDCRILHNAIDLEKYHYDETLRKITRDAYGLNGKFVIGHIGRYYYQKNHEFLIDIFNEVHKKDESAVLLLIGYGELKRHIFEKIQRLGLTEYVVDLGAREDIVQFYNAMDCFVLPSFYEGLPVVGIEAQAVGVPCLMSTEVTSETKITDVAEFISLDKPAAVWAEKILKWKGYQRKRLDDQVTSNGYNIKNEVYLLEAYYLNAIKNLMIK